MKRRCRPRHYRYHIYIIIVVIMASHFTFAPFLWVKLLSLWRMDRWMDGVRKENESTGETKRVCKAKANLALDSIVGLGCRSNPVMAAWMRACCTVRVLRCIKRLTPINTLAHYLWSPDKLCTYTFTLDRLGTYLFTNSSYLLCCLLSNWTPLEIDEEHWQLTDTLIIRKFRIVDNLWEDNSSC